MCAHITLAIIRYLRFYPKFSCLVWYLQGQVQFSLEMPDTGTNCGVPSQNLPLAPSVHPFSLPSTQFSLIPLELALRVEWERDKNGSFLKKKCAHLKKIKIIPYLLQSEISVGFKFFN